MNRVQTVIKDGEEFRFMSKLIHQIPFPESVYDGWVGWEGSWVFNESGRAPLPPPAPARYENRFPCYLNANYFILDKFLIHN